MGLDVSHDCWHGAYSAFMRWREKLAEVAGYPPLALMDGFYDAELWANTFKSYPWHVETAISKLPIKWDVFRSDPLVILLHHSDCEGHIDAKDCGPLAERLAQLIPLLPMSDSPGHIGSWRDKTQAFVDGLRVAYRNNEKVRFG